jgi:hypothetical protein
MVKQAERVTEPTLIIRMPDGAEVELGVSLEIADMIDVLNTLSDWRKDMMEINGGHGNFTLRLKAGRFVEGGVTSYTIYFSRKDDEQEADDRE